MPIQSPQELLILELQHIHDAETQASKALQQHLGQVENPKLTKLLERRLKEGERLLSDVEKCLQKLDGKSQATQNRAARGLIEEADRIVKEVQSPAMREAVIIAGTQKLEHYCIAAWGTVKAMAREVQEDELSQAMQRAVEEGYRWDREMTELAESRVNPSAMEMGGESEEMEEMEESEGSQKRSSRGSGQRSKQGGGDGSDLKEREYRGDDGQIHHHTKEYMERHGK